jgi:hypothetical protein
MRTAETRRGRRDIPAVARPRQSLHGKIRFRSINSVLVLRMTNADCWRRGRHVQQNGEAPLSCGRLGGLRCFLGENLECTSVQVKSSVPADRSQHVAVVRATRSAAWSGGVRHRGPVWRARYWRAAGAKVFNAKQLQQMAQP